MKNIDGLDAAGSAIVRRMKRRSLRSRLEASTFDAVLSAVATMARGPLRASVSPLLERTAVWVRRYRAAQEDPLAGEALGRAWQHLMPNPRVMPITSVEGDTAYGEIRIRCPLRGTGDVAACHRLMAYDRALMRPHGARFVVLESQAESGVERCRVAMRPAHLPAEDLLDAHVRVERLRARRD